MSSASKELEATRLAQRQVLLITSAATLWVLVTYTMPMGSLDPTFAGLGAGASGRSWVVSAMSVGLSATLLASGAMADAWGRRRVFLWGSAILAGASLLAAAAPNAATFVLARVLQGVGGAALTACSLGILGTTFTAPAARTRATAIWGASLGAGVALGPLLSAGLTAAWSWRGGHLLTGVVAAAIGFWGARGLSPSRAAQPPAVDLRGAAWLVVGLVALLTGLVEARADVSRPSTLATLAAGLAALVAFVRRQRRLAHPLIDLRLFHRPAFLGATVGALAAGMGMIALTSYSAVLMTRGMGIGGVAAAVIMLGWSGLSVLAATAAQRLPERFEPRMRMVVALVGVALGQLGLAWVDPQGGAARLLPPLLFSGAATGLLNATLGRQAVASVPAANAAMGSGANNSARYLGAAFGMTLVAMLLGDAREGFMDRWNLAVWITTGFSLIGAAVVYRLRSGVERAPGGQTAGA
jgi:MFS family permease